MKTPEKTLSYPSRDKYSDSVCYSMACKAIDDINGNALKIYEYGIVNSLDTNIYILKRYKIDLIYNGCVVESGIECYQRIVDSIIRIEFSNSLLKTSHDYFNRIRFKDEFFILPDSMAFNFNSKIVTEILSNISELTPGTFVIQVFINKTGKPIKIKWLKGLNKKTDSQVINELLKKTFMQYIFMNDTLNYVMNLPIKIK